MASDLSFNIVALDRASATFLKVAEQLDRVSEKLDRLDGKDVTANVNIRTDESQRALDSYTSRFKLLIGAVVASSPLAGAAILGGMGAAFIGVGALAQKSNEDVKAAYRGMWSDVVQTTRQASATLVPQFVGAANQMDATVNKLGPDIAKAFSFAGPDLVALTRGVDNFATNSMPGVVAAMEHGLPVFQGAANLMGELGSAVGSSLTSMSQHSTEYGAVLTAFGQIAGAVLGGVTSLVNDLAALWAANSTSIVGSVRGIIDIITGLGQGALPILSSALGVAADVINSVVSVLGPLAPLLGTVGAVALTTFAAFKLAALVEIGVRALAMGVVTMGGAMEAAAVRSTIAGGAVAAAGRSAASAAVGFGALASAAAAPIGIFVAIAAGVAALGSALSGGDRSAQQFAGAMDSLTAALQKSHGAFDQAAMDALKSETDFQNAAKTFKALGVSSDELARALTGQGGSIDAVRGKLQALVDAHHPRAFSMELDQEGLAAQAALNALNGLAGETRSSAQAAVEASAAQNAHARELASSSSYQAAAAGTANLLGLNLFDVRTGFQGVIAAGGPAAATLSTTAEAFLKNALAVEQASAAISDRFVQADKAVVQSQQAVADAQRGVEQSSRSAADAQHSLAQAQRAMQDALAGVTSAERNYARAQESARDAQRGLNEAREQAIQDLKELHLQLEDQVLSEEEANVRLFDAQKEASEKGVTSANARQIASQRVTSANEDQMKAALTLISAENALNNAKSRGETLRRQVADADAKGVEGSDKVRSAQNALRNAQDQVTSSANALQKAHQAVTDAGYGLQKAHQAVTDAQYQQQRATQQLQLTTLGLRDAQDAASRSLDIHTEAGRKNLGMVLQLWDTIEKTGLPVQDRYRIAIEQVADRFGWSKDRAAEYLKQLGLIPPDFKYGVTAVTQVDTGSIDRWLKDLPKGAFGLARTGLASGGPVPGYSPHDTADNVPIMATAGEWMHPVDAVDYYGPAFMEAVRTKRFPRGWDGAAMPGYASGGLISDNVLGASLGAGYLSTNNARRVMGFPTGPDLPKYVPPPAFFGGAIPGFAAGAGVAQWTAQTLQALAMLGLPGSFLPAVQRRMMQESGGNPTIVNLWDSNAAAGTPSVGLMQVIGPTYRAYAGPFAATGPFSYGVSVDPLANIYAGLNYAGHGYGGYGGFAGGVLYAMNKPGGYDNGGQVQPGWTPLWNGTGKPENVRTAAQEDAIVAAIRQLESKLGGHNYTVQITAAKVDGEDIRNIINRMNMMAPS